MSEAPTPATSGHRLRNARSIYLRSAAEQPIDWYPWGREPFDVARRLQRPILLDIGASWCHWCHVMDEGTYSDPEVASLLGQEFIAVKVDRDELPEIDRRYQQEVGTLTGEGGWPLTAFLTPEGATFFGGTYFPPADGHGRPGFRRVLREIARLYRQEPDRVRATIQELRDALARSAPSPTPSSGTAVTGGDFVSRVVAELRERIDPVHGGFGQAPKFPHPTAVSLLLLASQLPDGANLAEPALHTLCQMAGGGMYDQIGGGFHRYSVDEGWHIPHFEKMSVDNTALLESYLEAARYAPEPIWTRIARGILRWSLDTLLDPDGGWGASQDADASPGDDGNYFTWTREEIHAVLPSEEARFAIRLFGVGVDGRMPHDPRRNVLYRALSPSEAAAGVLPASRDPEAAAEAVGEALFRARSQRTAPAVDRALYAHINGRFIGALARASIEIDDASLLATARRAADRWIRHAFDPHRGIAHRLDHDGGHGFGHLEDQAQMALGLAELARITGEPRYAATVGDLLRIIDTEFPDEQGLYREIAPRLYDGPRIGEDLRPTYPLEDQPHMGAAPAAVRALSRWGLFTDNAELLDMARRRWEPMARRTIDGGLFAAGIALVGIELDLPATTVVVAGQGPLAHRLIRAAALSPRPNLVIFPGTPPPPFRRPELSGVAPAAAEPRALVCVGHSCRAPITDPGELSRLLREPPGRM
jgi:uncharacterized protein YyaL (SSP411 family)